MGWEVKKKIEFNRKKCGGNPKENRFTQLKWKNRKNNNETEKRNSVETQKVVDRRSGIQKSMCKLVKKATRQKAVARGRGF